MSLLQIQSRCSLSVWAIHLPSGDGAARQRRMVPPFVSSAAWPTPFAGSVQSSTSPDSSDSATRLLPSGKKVARR
ncbi:MAG TPA: hypothetical protein VGG39_15260 [Polyangiaceae bacterium]